MDKKKCPAELVKDSKNNRTGQSAGLNGKVIDGCGENSSSEMVGQRLEWTGVSQGEVVKSIDKLKSKKFHHEEN